MRRAYGSQSPAACQMPSNGGHVKRHVAQVAYDAVRKMLQLCPADCCVPDVARLSGEALLRSALPGPCIIRNVMQFSSVPIVAFEGGCTCNRLDLLIER